MMLYVPVIILLNLTSGNYVLLNKPDIHYTTEAQCERSLEMFNREIARIKQITNTKGIASVSRCLKLKGYSKA